MTVSSNIQLWGLGGSALSTATSALMNDRLNHVFAELDTGDRAIGLLCPVLHVSSGHFLVNVNTFIPQELCRIRFLADWYISCTCAHSKTFHHRVFIQPSVLGGDVLLILCICVLQLISQTAWLLYPAILYLHEKWHLSCNRQSIPPICKQIPGVATRGWEHMLSNMQKNLGFICISLIMG